MTYQNCTLCPRCCGIDRTAGQTGFCRCPDTAIVSHTMLHKWEEPVLAGDGGSGAVFFGGCTLGCAYCQNAAISRSPRGEKADSRRLREIFEELIDRGAENIDLVTPSHFLPTILPALEQLEIFCRGKYPRAASAIAAMTENCKASGFASYWD